MGVSARDDHFMAAARDIPFALSTLADTLSIEVARVGFAFILGSATDGCVARGGDLDVAVWYSDAQPIDWPLLSRTIGAVEKAVPGAPCDLGVLNSAGCVYRFETLQGRLLFCRAEHLCAYATFYSVTCREYEDYMMMLARHAAHRRAVRDRAAS